MTEDLPSGWVSVEIGELCDIINGKAVKRKEWSNRGLPIVRIQNLNNKDALFNFFQGEIEEKFIIENGQLLFAWSGTPGTSFGAHIWEGGRAVLNQHIYKVVFNEKYINKLFFKYAMNQKLEALISDARGGVGLKHITKKKFQKTKISLPPYEEQKKIVKKLEQLLSAVNDAKDRLDKVPIILKRFRQSVLLAAISGELTKDWRGGEAIESWRKFPLSEIIVEKPRNGYSPKAVTYETDVKSLTLTATTSGDFIPEHFKYIDEEIPEDSYLWLEENDILIQRANSLEYVGVSAIYRGEPKTFIYPDLMMKIKPNDDVLVGYLHYYLLCEPVREYFRNNATGTTGNMPKINQKVVMSTPIWVPELDEQQEVVSRVDNLFSLADELLAKQKKTYQKIINLHSSILAKAFKGELVPQNSSDESAENLLKHLKAVNKENPQFKRITIAPPKTTERSERKIMKDKAITNLDDLIVVLDSLKEEVITAERLVSEAGLLENIALFYELLREGRDTKRLDVPTGTNAPIRVI